MASKLNLKKVILLIRYLKEESSECEKICDKARGEFERSIRSAHYQFNVFDESLDSNSSSSDNAKEANAQDESFSFDNNETDDLSPEALEKKSITHPHWAKSMFRKIVMITHPDKIKDDTAEEERERLLCAYRESKIALDAKDYVTIIIIADDLHISMSDTKIKDNTLFSEKEKKLTFKISAYKNSLYWQWAHSSDEEKEKILYEFAKLRGWTSKESQRKKSRKGPGKHPGKSISQIKKSKILKK